MTPHNCITNMLFYLNSNDTANAYKTAEQYCNTLSPDGRNHYSLKRLLSAAPKYMQTLKTLNSDVKKLLLEDVGHSDEVFLSAGVKDVFIQFVKEIKSKELLNQHNLPVRQTLLFHGPTGNGKTTIAKNLAKRLELPFLQVNQDVVIDSKLGASAENVGKVFRQIQQPCVLFWDEIDTVAMKRGNSKDIPEIDRVLNSVLVNLEMLHEDVIFVGATNRFEEMDKAFIRRFGFVCEIAAPNNGEKLQYAEQLAAYHKVEINIDVVLELESFSAIKDYVQQAAREKVLSLTPMVTLFD